MRIDELENRKQWNQELILLKVQTMGKTKYTDKKKRTYRGNTNY